MSREREQQHNASQENFALLALAKQFRDGTCQVNCHNSIAYGLPYGGQGISGGPGGGVNCEETFLDYTQVKAVYVADYPD